MKNKMVPGATWSVSSSADAQGKNATKVENKGVFDEVKVDGWLHLERMTDNTWWMRVGQATLDIIVQPNGEAEVRVRTGEVVPMGAGVKVLK